MDTWLIRAMMFCWVSGILSPSVMHILRQRSQACRPHMCPQALFIFHESHVIWPFLNPVSYSSAKGRH